MSIPNVFESSDLIEILGMPVSFLNRLVERELQGIKPSIRSGVSTGGRRWFSKQDLFGVALVYWLFQAGLRAGSGSARSSVIQDVLDEIMQKPNATANEAAKRLTESPVAMLVVVQQLYPDPEGYINKKLQVRLMDEPFEPDDPINLNRYDIEIWIPVFCLFDRLDSIIASRS
jgi:hypothetical protein